MTPRLAYCEARNGKLIQQNSKSDVAKEIMNFVVAWIRKFLLHINDKIVNKLPMIPTKHNIDVIIAAKIWIDWDGGSIEVKLGANHKLRWQKRG